MAEITESLPARQAADELAAQLVVACDAVLARVWLMGPGDECPSCAMRTECPRRIRCLHLVSSAGSTARLDDAFRRFPIGARQVGRLAVTGEPLLMIRDLPATGIATATWLESNRVKSFAAVALRSG